jgi:hypothetical protein
MPSAGCDEAKPPIAKTSAHATAKNSAESATDRWNYADVTGG